MKFFQTPLAFLIFLLLISAPVSAFQANGAKVTGRVVEKGGSESVPFATIALLRPDSSVVMGVSADENGVFELVSVAPGNYLVKVSSIGFEPEVVPNVQVPVESRLINLGVIQVRNEANQLQEVKIVAEKSMIVTDIDKTSINIGQDLLASSNNASELLEKLPAVSMDENGSPMIRGMSNIVVLIDGKPSSQYGSDLATVLQSFPSDLIERIDVITSPSAKYEADGASGVIDIITKKATIVGMNGNVRLSAGNYDHYNAGGNFNYKSEKLVLRASGSYQTSQVLNTRRLNRQNLLGEVPSTLFQEGNGVNKNANGFGRIQAGYDFSPKTNVGASINFSNNQNESSGFTANRTVYPDDVVKQKFNRINRGNTDGQNITYGLDFRQEFSQREHNLTASLNYTTGGSDGRSDLIQESDEIKLQRQQYNQRDNNSRSLHGKIDFSWPVNENLTLIAGGHTRQNTRNNNNLLYTYDSETGDFIYDERISNIFGYRDALYSGYVSATQKWKDWGFRAGLRLSNMTQYLDQVSMNRKFSVHFLNMIPSFSVSRKIDDASLVKLNYSRRVQRPNADWLNPYTDITDPRNIRTGNPNLSPEFTHRMDLGYSNYKEVLGIGSSLFTSYSNNAITTIRTIDEEGISYTSFDNVGRDLSYGVETDLSLKLLGDKLKINTSGRFFRNEIVSVPAQIDNRRWSFSGNLNTFFQLPAGLRGSVYVNYDGPKAIAQGTRMGVFQGNASIRKSFFEKRAFISLNIQDIFLSRRYRNNLATPTYIQHSEWHRTNRYIGITANYKFGKIMAQQG
ncbi:TonB-dependent receptor domain-containing protein [Ravibacter arvi]|uniref:TonB-dependent receptor domain-containing protein n=1 Tax=Ravibacter arvi TaxID=2051041 RepID=UPI0031E83303